MKSILLPAFVLSSFFLKAQGFYDSQATLIGVVKHVGTGGDLSAQFNQWCKVAYETKKGWSDSSLVRVSFFIGSDLNSFVGIPDWQPTMIYGLFVPKKTIRELLVVGITGFPAKGSITLSSLPLDSAFYGTDQYNRKWKMKYIPAPLHPDGQ